MCVLGRCLAVKKNVLGTAFTAMHVKGFAATTHGAIKRLILVSNANQTKKYLYWT
jgi:hypothetical protein